VTAYATGQFPNPYVATEVHSVPASPGGAPLLAAAITHLVDQNGNEMSTIEYGWSAGSVPRDSNQMVSGPPSGAPIARATTTTYHCPSIAASSPPSGSSVSADSFCAYWNPSSPSLRHLVTRSVTSLTGPGSDYAATEYCYDNCLPTPTAGNVRT